MLEKNYFRDAEKTRGRFRTFLLASVRHFVANERDAEMARKRGGGFAHVSLEVETEERRFHREPSEDDTPERLYERRWALAALDAAMKRLSERYEDSGQTPDVRRAQAAAHRRRAGVLRRALEPGSARPKVRFASPSIGLGVSSRRACAKSSPKPSTINRRSTTSCGI